MERSKIPYKISYRDIKYPRLEFTTGMLLLVLPFGHDHRRVLEKHQSWIKKKTALIETSLKDTSNRKPAYRTEHDFKGLVHALAESASRDLNVSLGEIRFRKMKTKWASLSPRGTLSINMLMKDLPNHLIKYIILHETAHLVERKHNERFWRLIADKYRTFQAAEREIFAFWFLFSQRTVKF